MTYALTSQYVGCPIITDTDTTQKVPIGTRIKAYDLTYGEGEFIYLRGLASTAIGEVVIYDEYANTTKRGVANDRGPAAVAMSANVASQYGWYQIAGAASCKVATGFAAGGGVFLTSTPGTVAAAVVATDKIDGARGKTALDTPTTGFAVVMLDHPSANGNG